MKGKYLQTVLSGCAWCKTVIGVKNHEVEHCTIDKPMILSHGICLDCKNTFEEDQEDSSEEDRKLIFA